MVAASRSMANISSGIRGSSRYLAIELLTAPSQVCEGSTGHTTKTDVWAFGMTAYVSKREQCTFWSYDKPEQQELFTHQRPYVDYSDIQVISAIITRQVPSFPPRSPFSIQEKEQDTLVNVCQVCWSHDPATRPDMESILDLLQDCQGQKDEEFHSPLLTPTTMSRDGNFAQVDELVQLGEPLFRVSTNTATGADTVLSGMEYRLSSEPPFATMKGTAGTCS